MNNIISITGDLGSGKSTVSNILCKRTKYNYIYTGKIQREIASKYNMTTTELNKYSETHPEIDQQIDAVFKSLNSTKNLIADSRLAWFFIPNSFKIYLKTNIIISAERISNDLLRKNEKYSSKDDAIHNIIERKKSENKRYFDLYGADCSDMNNFNLIIDTSFLTPETIAEIIIKKYETWQQTDDNKTHALISPQNLYPTKSVKNFNNKQYNEIFENVKTNGYDTDNPVKIISLNSFYYIFDGHKRTSAAIKNNINLIPVKFLKEDDFSPKNPTYKTEIIKSIKQSTLHHWEDFNSFRFLTYPHIK